MKVVVTIGEPCFGAFTHIAWWTHWHHQGACSVVQAATAAASCTFDSSQVTVTKPRSDFLTHVKFSRSATVSTAHSPQF